DALRQMHGTMAFYPEAARANGIAGNVAIEASLDAKGHVIDARVLSGPSELRAAALRSVLDTHFAAEGNAPRQVQLRGVFSLEKPAAGRVRGGTEPPAPGEAAAVGEISCFAAAAVLCSDVRARVAAHADVGSPFTPEKKAAIEKDLADLDDHLQLNAFK